MKNMKNVATCKIKAVIPRELKKAVIIYAHKNGVSLSDMAYFILESYLKDIKDSSRSIKNDAMLFACNSPEQDELSVQTYAGRKVRLKTFAAENNVSIRTFMIAAIKNYINNYNSEDEFNSKEIEIN